MSTHQPPQPNSADPYPLNMDDGTKPIDMAAYAERIREECERRSLVAELPCQICSDPIGEDRYLRNRIDSTYVHADCLQARRYGFENRRAWDESCRLRRAREELEQRQLYESQFEAQRAKRLECVPCGPWTVVGSDEYHRAVSDQKLRGFVARWHEKRLSTLMLGPSRSGKTTAAAAMVRRLFAELECRPPDGDDTTVATIGFRYDWGILRSFLWTDGFKIANAKRYSPFGAEPKLIEQAKSATLLVVDEVGQEQYDGTLFEVINDRYVNGSPTIVTDLVTRTVDGQRYVSQGNLLSFAGDAEPNSFRACWLPGYRRRLSARSI